MTDATRLSRKPPRRAISNISRKFLCQSGGRRDTQRAAQAQTTPTHIIVFGKFNFARIAATATKTEAAQIPIAIFSFVAACIFIASFLRDPRSIKQYLPKPLSAFLREKPTFSSSPLSTRAMTPVVLSPVGEVEDTSGARYK